MTSSGERLPPAGWACSHFARRGKTVSPGDLHRSAAGRLTMAVRPAVRNHWPDAKCAKAFWSQQELRPYRRLLADTIDWAAPAAGETWLDLGGGGGPPPPGVL